MSMFKGIDSYLGLLLFEIRRVEEEFKIPAERTHGIKALIAEMLLSERTTEDELFSDNDADNKPVIWH